MKLAVEIAVADNAGLDTGIDEGIAHGMRFGLVRNRERPPRPVVVVPAALLILGAAEIRQASPSRC